MSRSHTLLLRPELCCDGLIHDLPLIEATTGNNNKPITALHTGLLASHWDNMEIMTSLERQKL